MMQQILLGLGGAADTFISASGGSESTDGDFKVHVFGSTGPMTFSVSQIASGSAPNNVEYLVIAGGGGGGSHIGGGGGAGGVISNHPSMPSPRRQPVPSGGLPATGNYAISIGGGGAGAATHGQHPPETGSKGTPTTLNGLAGGNLEAEGGGGGGAGFSEGQGGDVGSGGGAGHVNNSSLPAPELSTAPTNPAQGFAGGTSNNPHTRGGGGGGAAHPFPGGPGAAGGTGGPGIVIIRYKFQ